MKVKIKRRIKRTIINVNINYGFVKAINKVTLYCLNAFSIGRYRKLPLIWLDDVSGFSKKVLLENKIVTTVTTTYLGTRKELKVTAPSVSHWIFKDAYLCPDSSSIICNDQVIIERISYVPDSEACYAAGFLSFHDTQVGLLCYKNVVELEEGNYFFLGGNGSKNYYHFMIELLPKLYFFVNRTGAAEKVLISHDLFNFPSVIKILYWFEKRYNIEYVKMKSGTVYKLKEVNYISSLNNVLFNSKINKCRASDVYIRSESVRNISDFILEHIEKKDNLPKRIFLARKPGRSRNNPEQDSIIKFLESYSVQAIFLEDLSVDQQVNLFRNAEMIIGASGAAWSNVIFCNSNPICITWLPFGYEDFSAFSTLADCYNIQLHRLNVAVKQSDNRPQADYSVDLNRFYSDFSFLINEL